MTSASSLPRPPGGATPAPSGGRAFWGRALVRLGRALSFLFSPRRPRRGVPSLPTPAPRAEGGAASSEAALALHVARTLRAHGHQALFVGGCVRDLLLGREPRDYDVATSARPEEVRRLFPRTVEVGARFGVVRVVDGPRQVEVATFRTEEGYRDGRRPGRVAFGSPEEDARRRDFTINALYQDPETGEILDLAGGREDLEAWRLRAIGAPRERFLEDHLRLLRAVRLASELGLRIEEGTWRALVELAPLAARVSGERVREEVLRWLLGPDPARGLDLLDASGLLEVLLPEVAALHGVAQPPDTHPEGDVFTHVRRVLEGLPGASPRTPALALAALFHDIGKAVATQVRPDGRITFHGHAGVGAEMVAAIARRLALPAEVRDRVIDLVARHMDLLQAPQMRRARLLRLLSSPLGEELLALHMLDKQGGSGDLSTYHYCREVVREAEAARTLRPPRLVTGRDLLALGLSPGPVFGVLLREVEDAQLEGRIRGREEALAWLRARIGAGEG